MWLISISRILISQDHDEIYVTLAEYKVSYISYLKNRVDVDNKGFLVMTTYGPFVTINSKHMAWLGGILRVLLPYAATYEPRHELSPSRVPRTPSPVAKPPPAVDPLLAGREKAGEQHGKGQGQKAKKEPSPLNRKSEDGSTSSDGGVPIGKIGLPDRTSDGRGSSDPTLRPRMSLGSLKDIRYGEPVSAPAEQSTAQRGRQQPAPTDSGKGKKKRN